MKKIDVRIMDYMMDKKVKLGSEKTTIRELEELNIPEKKLKKALGRLEKVFIQIIE